MRDSDEEETGLLKKALPMDTPPTHTDESDDDKSEASDKVPLSFVSSKMSVGGLTSFKLTLAMAFRQATKHSPEKSLKYDEESTYGEAKDEFDARLELCKFTRLSIPVVLSYIIGSLQD